MKNLIHWGATARYGGALTVATVVGIVAAISASAWLDVAATDPAMRVVGSCIAMLGVLAVAYFADLVLSATQAWCQQHTSDQ